MKTIILIVNYNNSDNCIKLIKSINIKDTDIAVLDNNSIEKEKKKLESFFLKNKQKEIKFYQNNVNEGFSKGYNKLIKKNKNYDLFIISNDDVTIEEKTISNIKENIKTNKKVIIPLVKKIINNTKTNKILTTGRKKFGKKIIFNLIPKKEKRLELNEQSIQVSAGTFVFVAIPKQVFQEIGLFDEDFFLFNEDTEFYNRLKRYNIPVYLIPNIIIYHPIMSSSSNGSKPKLWKQRIRSSIIYWRKHKNWKGSIRYIVNYSLYIVVKLIQTSITGKPLIRKQIVEGLREGAKLKLHQPPKL